VLLCHLAELMRNYPQHILVFSFALLIGNIAAFSQEAGSPSFEAYDTEHLRERDRILATPGESVDPQRSTISPPPSRDTSTVKAVAPRNVFKPSSVVPKEQNKSKDQKDDSILSFNFLYYLIQKYKMQDIID
jgi:hypothetical protein